jgi:hypothetical protein
MTASISFQGNVACGGASSLVLKDDGTCVFHGHFHDAGFVPYGVAFAMVVHTDSGKAFSFTKTGHVSGTLEILEDATKSRNFDWDDFVQNDAIKAAWPDILQGFDFHWKAEVNVDVTKLLADVVGIVKQLAPIVTSVVAIV